MFKLLVILFVIKLYARKDIFKPNFLPTKISYPFPKMTYLLIPSENKAINRPTNFLYFL